MTKQEIEAKLDKIEDHLTDIEIQESRLMRQRRSLYEKRRDLQRQLKQV